MNSIVSQVFLSFMFICLMIVSTPCQCDEPTPAPSDGATADQSAAAKTEAETSEAEASETDGPVITDSSKMPVAAELSPWEKRAAECPKRLWADSFLWAEAPEIIVESWYNQAPEKDFKKKYILLEVWATWCPPCRRTLPMLNHWHEKFGDELCVIAICETDAQALDECVGNVKGKDMKFHVGIDLKKRTANAMGVFGIPHAVIIEPVYGCVIWEGMPNQPGHELTDEIIEKILAIGRKNKLEQK